MASVHPPSTRPLRPAARRATTVALALLAGLLLPACGGGGEPPDQGGPEGEAPSGETRVFKDRDFDIRFRYPVELELDEDFEFGALEENGPEASVGARLGLHNFFAVQRFDIGRRITEQNLDEFAPEADAAYGELIGQEISGEPTEVGGLPALRYEFESQQAEDASTEAIFVFDGSTQYLLSCASTPRHRELIEAACATAVETLEPTGE